MSNLIRYINQDNHENDLNEEIFQRVLKRTFDEEGGYEDRKNRIEMPTNMGIRQDTLERFKQKHPDLSFSYPSHVKDINKEQAAQIYRKDYFEPYGIGDIKHKALQETMFDSFVNHSPKEPAIWSQKAINNNTNIKVDEDGIFGPRTRSALNYLDNDDDVKKVNNYILDERLKALEKQKSEQGLEFRNRTLGIPNRIERFRIK